MNDLRRETLLIKSRIGPISLLSIIISVLFWVPSYARLTMRGHTAAIKVCPGATFSIDQVISNFSGSLIREAGGIITGQDVIFNHGVFENEGNDLLLTATLSLSSSFDINLTGNSLLRAEPGRFLSTVNVSGENNRIEGRPRFTGDIALLDSNTTLTIAVQSTITGNIDLSGGTLILEDNLSFADNKLITGSGTVNLNGHALSYGGQDLLLPAMTWENASDLRLWSNITLTEDQIFKGGKAALNANGHVVNLNGYSFVFDELQSNITDVTIKGFGSGSFIFTNNTNSVHMSNVTIVLDDDVTSTNGEFYVKGPSTIIVKEHTWTFDQNATLTVDGITLWLDPAGSETVGGLDFDSFANLSIINTGTIAYVGSGARECDLEERVEGLEECCESLTYTVGLLVECCEETKECCEKFLAMLETYTLCTIDITVTGELFFPHAYLPDDHQAVVIKFCPRQCTKCGIDKPRVIFDPAVFGHGGRVELPKCSRLVFCGEGFVVFKDGIIIDFAGTPGDITRSDWPDFVLDDGAILKLDMNATLAVGGLPDSDTHGAGKIIVRKGSAIMLDRPSHLVFGEQSGNEIILSADFGGIIHVNDPDALISVQTGTFDLLFENNSRLIVEDGIVELNTLNGEQRAGIIRSVKFIEGSELDVVQHDCTTSGLLRLSPNAGDTLVDWDSRTGFVKGKGDLQFLSFDTGENIAVDSTVQIQNNRSAVECETVQLFMMLGYITEPGTVESPDATILTQFGTRPNPALCGHLAAFCPSRNGSIIGLDPGAHDVFYCRSRTNGPLDTIRGIGSNGRLFSITCR